MYNPNFTVGHMPVFSKDDVIEAMEYVAEELHGDIAAGIEQENPGFFAYATTMASSIARDVPSLANDPTTLIVTVALLTYWTIRHLNESYLSQDFGPAA